MLKRLRIAVGFAAWVTVLSALLIVELSYQPPNDSKKNQPYDNSTQDVDRRTPDERLADYTMWLERFTGLLVAVTAIQIGFLLRADRASQRAFEASTKATRDSMELAERRFALQGLQTDVLEKQKEIQRTQLVALHRPRLAVREVYWVDEKTPAIGFILVNRGVDAAYISECRLEFNRTDERPILPEGENALADMTPLPGGAARVVTVDVGSTHGLTVAAFDLGFGDEVTFHGVIVYGNGYGASYYRTVFKRVCGVGESVFRRTDNPDDEYSD